eukprot:TRINITY_DN101713_c0_g1_i1.p1 TRINITY_DN101713_c0_g1~~TRINITY_DN101713_c0_g1_i1.p1  ORF type:complete len:388 (-),score=57.29 TRINITY_DN101713_c0_g1_i1:122-1285(-)
MTCLADFIPCKYFAAGGCWCAASKKPCWESVGSNGDWVVKTHSPGDGQEFEAAWLSQRLYSSGVAKQRPTPSQPSTCDACLSGWRERYQTLADVGDVTSMLTLSEQIQSALDEPGKLTGRDREAAKKIQRKASRAASAEAADLKAASADASRKAADRALAAELKTQPYLWAVVVDLEGKPPNICEFPAIVLDTSTGCEVGRFHRWVRSGSSDKLWGDARNSMSNAVGFPEAFSAFEYFLRELGVEEGTAILVCCGDFDANALFKMHLHHGLPAPALLSRWVNLKEAVFKIELARFGGDLDERRMRELATNLDGMNRLAGYLAIPGIETAVEMHYHHLGMYDTTKIAMILVHLILQKGLVVRETAIRDIVSGKMQRMEGPRLKDFSDR